MIRLAAIATAVWLLATPTQAHNLSCMPNDILAKKLEGYAESLTAYGLTTMGGRLVQVYVSETGGWTIIITPPGAPSTCVLESGKDWTSVPHVYGAPT